MVSKDAPLTETFRQEDPFASIREDEFEGLGIDPADIPPGTFAAHKHPPQLPSRFGGNAYGFGFFEIYNRLYPEDIKLLQSSTFDKPDQIKQHYKKINQIYKKIGLLIRFSGLGKPYYLIPVHLLSTSLANIKNKADEIKKIIDFHRKKYMKESAMIGLLTHADDPIINDLSVRFKEHEFIIIASLEKLRSMDETLDLVIITRDLYGIILMEKFSQRSSEILSRKQLHKYAQYMLGKIYKVLKPDGEIFIIALRQPVKTNQTTQISFATVKEQKNFLLFSHIFKTRKRYKIKGKSLSVNVFDLQRYLGGLYVEQEVLDRLSGDQDIEKMTLKEIDNLPYLNFPLDDEFAYDQQKVWPKLLSIYFNAIFHKPMIPNSVKAEWKRRFSVRDYSPDYMLIHLAQKKPLDTTLNDLKNDIMKSRLAGCPLLLLADYRDSFDYLIRTLNVLNNIKNDSYSGLPEIFIDRLREPLENKKRRYSGLNDVLKLMSKINRLEKIQSYLNPDMIEGARTKVPENLEIFQFYGFSYGELKEIFLIIVGHTTMGRVLSGKMNEKTLKPVSDLARTYDSQQALNLLRYCRLMSMAETVASRRTDMNQGQLSELFDLFDTMVRVVTSREMDWDRLLDEKISSMGGIHNKIIQKLLMMMNYFEFLNNWAELRQKGDMEKESLADYDDKKMASIEDIISLVRGIERFENRFLKDDPLQLPIFYRKILNMEFHGTGHIFERIDSQLVFILLWITVNVTRGEVINFNPILAGVKFKSIDAHVKKVGEEARSINFDFLDLTTLKQLGKQLYEKGSAFIANTGFQLRLDKKAQAVEITFIDIHQNIEMLEVLAKRFEDHRISEVPSEELEEMERLFTNLERFCQDCESLLSQSKSQFKVPERQQIWFKRAQDLRQYIRSNFIDVIFEPEDIYTDLDRLYRHSRSILYFIIPEILAFHDLKPTGKIYLKSSIIDHILTSTRKIQALIRGDRKEFQDIQILYKLAQREFGPMAAGIVGLNESQVETLESIVRHLRNNQPLFDALIKSFIFQDLGMIPALREKYGDQLNPADQAQAGALFLKKEKIPLRYHMDEKARKYLILLVRYHDRIHHMVRGEFSFHALQAIIDIGDKELFDAFFVSSFVMCTALGEDLILEDLASRLFQIKTLCHMIIAGEITVGDHLEELYAQRGDLFYALEEYQKKGLPENMAPAEYLTSWERDESEKDSYIKAGRMIYSMERIFRLKGLRYIEFSDLANLIVKVPLRFIFQKRNYFGIGLATFEKEGFEALRIYNSVQRLPEEVRHFIQKCLEADKVRIFGFENVCAYLNYENMIKLLFITLLGSQKMKKGDEPICLDFLSMVEKIKKRYEAVNDSLNDISVEKIWMNRYLVNQLFKAKTGLLLKKDESKRVLTVDFMDRINPLRKISHMKTVTDVDQLKNYFHSSLHSLRKIPFYTDDYELQLEDAFYQRLEEISDLMLDQVKRQMELLNDFREIHHLYSDLMDRSLEIGFTADQKHRLNDLYELRKDELKKKKLDEINGLIDEIQDINELKDYWDGVKWYLLNNRAFIGKEFENLIARNFDEAINKIRDMSFEAHLMS
ncbi:MAG: hypothetical protein JRC68_03465 [Deltaproteobacteria bacterium]|nr:hypothetical protein [Deltaproteobacteria bacterium]